MLTNIARALLGVMVMTAVGSEAWSADPVQRPVTLLRISKEALGNVQHKTFEVEQAVSDLILGTKIRGQSKTSAKCSIEPCASKASNGLQIVVTGTSVTVSEGRNGPAIIHSTTTTQFTASAPLHFDPETGLKAETVEVVAESKVTTDDIQSTQKGIAGTFVKKLAAKKIEESREEAQAIARDLAIKRIEKAVAAEIATSLAQVNESYSQLLPAVKAVHNKGDSLRMIADNGNLLVCLGDNAKLRPDQLPKLSDKVDLLVPSTGLNPQASGALVQLTKAVAVPITTTARVTAPRPQLVRHEGWLIVKASDPTLIAEQ